MTNARYDDRVGAWIREAAPERAPSHLRQHVRDAVERVDQRSGWFELRGLPQRAAGVAAVALIVVGLLAASGLIGFRPLKEAQPTPTLKPTASLPASAAASAAPTPPGTILAPGLHLSAGFTPAVSFTVPEGWTLQLDSNDLLIIVPAGAGAFRQQDGLVLFDDIALYARPHAGQPDGAQQPVEGVGTGAQELASWLSERPQVTATEPVVTTLAGVTAYQVDIEVAPTAGELCGVPCTNLLDGPTTTSYALGISAPGKVRAYLLEAPNGDTIVVAIEDVDGVGFEDHVGRASSIVESLAFRALPACSGASAAC